MRSVPVKLCLLVCWILVLCPNAVAQLSDLRQSRQPLPGVSDISHIGISVELGSTQPLMHPHVIVDTLQSRLETLGYHVTLAPTPRADGLWLQVDCQSIQAKADSRPRVSANKAAENSSRLVPPCHLTYLYQHEVIPWKNIDRLIYSESLSAMQEISKIFPPLQLEDCVEQFFQIYDVPILLAAEWGHVGRLLHVLNHSDTSVSRQRLILTLLGETRVERGYSILVEKLQERRLASVAAEALGFFGLRAQAHLLPLVQDRSDPHRQAAAAKGLGRIAAATGNSQYTPLYLKMVADSTIDMRVRTQLVWALGKAPDMRAFPTLLQLEKHLWDDHAPNAQLQEFREAVDWSIREVKQGGHGDDF